MKKQSRTVPRRRQSVSPTPRYLPLVDILIDTQAELQELVVASGLKVLEAMLEEDRTAVCGPLYAHQPERQAYRAGHTPSQVVLSGRKVAMRRPRARREALVHGSRALGEPRSTSWPSWRQQVHDLDMKSRVHPKYKTKYHVLNWPAYDRALVQRGDITVWLAPDAIAAWEAVGVGHTWRAAAVFRSRHRNRADAPAHLPPAPAAD